MFANMAPCVYLQVVVSLLALSPVFSEDLMEGLYCGSENCYDVLEVTRDSSKSEISRAYRQLARKWHPDMFRTQKDKDDAVIMFRKVATAYETLKDEDARRDYDYMLDHPDEYYFNYYKYYRRQVAPQVDVRIVIAVTISVISVVQYLSAMNNYKAAINYFATVPKYRMQAIEIARQERLLDINKKKRDKTKTKEELKEEEENLIRQVIEMKMDIRGGIQKPSLCNVLWLQLVLFPYHVVIYVWWWLRWLWRYTILRGDYDDEAKHYLIQRNLRVSHLQYEQMEDTEKEQFMELELWKKQNFKEWKEKKDEEMKAVLAQSSKHKAYRRYLKKGGPGQMTFGPE